MKHGRWWAALGVTTGLLAVLFSSGASATLKHKRETGKKCTFCHTRIPEKGARDPRLNEEGKRFKDNGYKLTEEQKKKPQSGAPSPSSGFP